MPNTFEDAIADVANALQTAAPLVDRIGAAAVEQAKDASTLRRAMERAVEATHRLRRRPDEPATSSGTLRGIEDADSADPDDYLIRVGDRVESPDVRRQGVVVVAIAGKRAVVRWPNGDETGVTLRHLRHAKEDR